MLFQPMNELEVNRKILLGILVDQRYYFTLILLQQFYFEP